MNLNNQNTEKSLKLLAAKDALYTSATTWSYLVYTATLAPLALQILKPWLPPITQFTENAVSLIGLFAVIFVDRLVQHRIKTATQIYEEFDTDLFVLPWNEAISDTKIPPEERDRMAGDPKNFPNYKNWYTPESLSNVEHSRAVLLCQRQNARWDLKQKQRFAHFLGWILVLSGAALLGWGWWGSLAAPKLLFETWVSSGLFPASAFLLKSWMLYRDFQKAINVQETLAGDIDSAWDESLSVQSPVSDNRLRHFQDRIFGYRKENTLVPGWLFGWFKTDDQKFATAATLELAGKIQIGNQ